MLDGKPLSSGNVQEAVRRGMALVPEDRQHEGLVLPMSVMENLSLAVLSRLTNMGLIRPEATRTAQLTFPIAPERGIPRTGVPSATKKPGC